MSNLGEYQVLTTKAKELGGPGKLINQFINEGKKQGRQEMIPHLVLATLTGCVLSKGYAYAKTIYIRKKEERKLNLQIAKENFTKKIILSSDERSQNCSEIPVINCNAENSDNYEQMQTM